MTSDISVKNENIISFKVNKVSAAANYVAMHFFQCFVSLSGIISTILSCSVGPSDATVL